MSEEQGVYLVNGGARPAPADVWRCDLVRPGIWQVGRDLPGVPAYTVRAVYVESGCEAMGQAVAEWLQAWLNGQLSQPLGALVGVARLTAESCLVSGGVRRRVEISATGPCAVGVQLDGDWRIERGLMIDAVCNGVRPAGLIVAQA